MTRAASRAAALTAQLFVGCLALSGTALAATVTYTGDLANTFQNPERGFHNRYEIIDDASVNKYASNTIPGFNPDMLDRTFARAKTNGNTIIHSYLHLDDFTAVDTLPPALLNNLASGLAAIRAAGMKLVIRPAYTWDGYVTVPEARMLGHISQINAVLSANADVILHVEAGYLGAWGEWHTGGYTNSSDRVDGQTRYRLLRQILRTTPSTIPVVMRYPIYWKEMVNPTLAGAPSCAFTNISECDLTQAEKDRIGFHNDCFLADYNDQGTYDNPSWMGWWYIEDKKQWMYDMMTSFGSNVMVGGETCGSAGWNDAAAVNVQTEMQQLNFTEINQDYWEGNINIWKNANLAASGNDPAETAFVRIKRKMGSRLRLVNATFPTSAVPGGSFQFSANVSNDGWAGLIKSRPVFLTFQSSGGRFDVPLTGLDPRKWLSGSNTITTQTVTLPANMPAGSYKLALWLPDQATGLRARAEYSVRLANQGTWDAAAGYNVLSNAISIGSCSGDCAAPSAPTLNSPSKTSSSVSLAWSGAIDNVGVTGYDVYRGATKVNASTVTGTTYTDTGLAASTAYSYTVRARDAAGNESVASNTVTVTTDAVSGDTTPPTAPTLSSPSKTSSSVSLAWSGAIDNVGVTGYDVYRDVTKVNASAITGTTYVDSGLAASTSYNYTVRSLDAAGNVSVASNLVTVTTNAAVPTLSVDDFDGTPNYPSAAQNDLGKWTGANGFANGGGAGAVSAGALNLQYSNAGWFGSDIYTDVSSKTYLVLRIKGTAGGEQSQFQLGIGGATKMFNQFTTSTGGAPVITTSYQEIKIPMAGNGINRSSPGQLTLAFWFGASGTISIDGIYFE